MGEVGERKLTLCTNDWMGSRFTNVLGYDIFNFNKSRRCLEMQLEPHESDFGSCIRVGQKKINSKIQTDLLRPIGGEKNNKNFDELMQNFIGEYKNFK